MNYYFDDTKVDGYYAIRSHSDEDDIIWIDCSRDQLDIIIAALNEK